MDIGEVYRECLLRGAMLIIVHMNSDGTVTGGVRLKAQVGGGSAMVTDKTDCEALLKALKQATEGRTA